MTDLSPAEVRVLGCLIEKQRTTPDAYPLTLNALRLACNQSTNRDPVTDFDDAVVREAVHRLVQRGYARLASGAGSRAAKYRHLLRDRLEIPDGELAVLAVLLLRGAQTPGELKQRGERMHSFASLEEVEEALEGLIARQWALRRERRPGQKEVRYVQLLSGEPEAAPADRTAASLAPADTPPVPAAPADAPAAPTAPTDTPAAPAEPPAPAPLDDVPAAPVDAPQGPAAGADAEPAPARLARLKREIAALRDELAELRELMS